MTSEKRAESLSEFIFLQTKDFHDDLKKKYIPLRNAYFVSTY